MVMVAAAEILKPPDAPRTVEVPDGYKQTEAGLIPEDWDLPDVGALLIKVASGTSRRSLGRGQYSLYGSTGMIGVCDSPEYSGDSILVARVGANAGTIYAVDGEYGVTDNTIVLKTSENVDFHFIVYYFERQNLNQLVFGSGQPLITGSQIKRLKIPLPPTKREQEVVAEALGEADAFIESLEQHLEKKRSLKEGVMQASFSVNAIEENRTLGEVSSLKGRIGWQGLTQAEFTSNGNDPFLITGMNFKDGSIEWNDVYHVPQSRYDLAPDIQLRQGDVLMTKDGTIGKVLYIDDIPFPGKATLNSHLLLFRPLKCAYNPKYLYYQLASRRFQNFIGMNKSGSTFFGISQRAMEQYPVLLPPQEDQDRIASVLTDIDDEISVLGMQLRKAREIKQGMMQELLTGRIRLV